MKLYRRLFFLLSLLFVLVSCNKDEGFGGSCSIEGYVYNIVHHNKNFSFLTDTVPASEWRVYILAGENGAVLDDVRTNYLGMYRFDYLRSGTYPVYAYSEYPNDIYRAEMVEVKAGKGLNVADTIYVHSGKAFGTSIIQGSVYATYYHNGVFMDAGVAIEQRVSIKRVGEVAPFNDTRVGDLGIFAFEGVLPGDYEIYVVNEDEESEKPTVPHLIQVTVTETGIVYQLPEEQEGLHVDEDGNKLKYTFVINIAV